MDFLRQFFRIAIVPVLAVFLTGGVSHAGAQDCLQQKASADTAGIVKACSAMLASDGLSDEDRVAALLARGKTHYSDRDFNSAIRDFEQALQIDPASREATLYRAYAYVAVGRVRRAQRELLALIDGSTDRDALSLASVVREVATTAEPHRHGQLALRLIEESEPIALDDPVVLEAVAAAYASDRKFDYAVRAQYQAMKLAEKAGDDGLAGYRTRFELYKLKQALVCPGMPECW